MSYQPPSALGNKLSGGTGPVSYTHLDVYKRQSLGCENLTHEQFAEELGPYDPARVKFLSCQDVEDEMEAVSYTHLDVYKRQGWKRPLRWCVFPPAAPFLPLSTGALAASLSLIHI